MGQIALQIPQSGQPNSTEDVKVANSLTTLQTWANGNVDATNVSAAFAQSAAVNQGGQAVKGAVSIAASESRSNTAFGTLATPDQVTGIVLPSNGLIKVSFAATWQESVAGAGNIAIFIGANQLVVPSGSSAGPQTQAAAVQGGATTAINRPVVSCPFGLVSPEYLTAYTGDVTTGQAMAIVPGASTNLYFSLGGTVTAGTATNIGGLGGPVLIDNLPAGTYTISVQYKASSGSITASNRRLRVQALSFA